MAKPLKISLKILKIFPYTSYTSCNWPTMTLYGPHTLPKPYINDPFDSHRVPNSPYTYVLCKPNINDPLWHPNSDDLTKIHANILRQLFPRPIALRLTGKKHGGITHNMASLIFCIIVRTQMSPFIMPTGMDDGPCQIDSKENKSQQ